jgi:hypothetical protein
MPFMHFFFPFFILLGNLLIQPRFLNQKGFILGFNPFVSGGIASHHIVTGILGILVGLFHQILYFNDQENHHKK